MPPQVNATLTRVLEATAAAGDRDDWDDPGVEPAGAGDAKWEGAVDAYYAEKVTRQAGVALEVFTARRLVIDTADYHELELDTNDVVEFTGPAGPVTARAVSIAAAELDGIPRGLQTTRIELEPA